LLKKKRKKEEKSIFFGVLFREDSFKDIVREKKKKENLSMMRVMYQATNVTKVW
jgi:hypothetical protein